ncbi:MAG: LamG domain-containing protein [Armatimonadetes bacterium]|nr:LamG domain-containing protein [Armatimonadota bacterium]
MCPWLPAASLPAALCLAATVVADAAQNDVVWTSPSLNSAGSMPLGNGDIGLNLWVEESGDLVFYLSKTDAWSESARLLKLGRVRVSLAPNPFATGAPFSQRLDLGSGAIRIAEGDAAVELTVWVDANRPVVHVEVTAPQAVTVTASLEMWRTAPRELAPKERFSAYGVADSGKPVVQDPDVLVDGAADRVVWCHRNERSIWAESLTVQGLGELVPRHKDPLLGRTFGGCIMGDGLKSAGPDKLTSAPFTRHDVRIVCLTEQADSSDAWRTALDGLVAEAAKVTPDAARAAHLAWWSEFWSRSWIEVTDPTEVAGGGGIVPTHRPLRFGADSDDHNRFLGQLKRARLYSRGLSPEEIAKLASDWHAAPEDRAGLLGDWTFDSPDGQYANAVGDALPTHLVGKGEVAASELGPALNLTGDGWAEVDYDKALDLTRAVTLEAWIRPEQLPGGGARILDTTLVGTSKGYLLDTFPGNSLRLIVDAGTVSKQAALPAGQWSHVAATFDAVRGVQRLCLNGKVVAEQATGADYTELGARTTGQVVSQGYALQRFINACAGRGAYAIKFNGSIFTVDSRETDEVFDGDYRRWGGPYWFQNTRLPYWSMLAAGDLDLMQPLFRMYGDALPFCEERTRRYFGHGGAFYPETMYFWGAYATDNYGWNREGKPISQCDNTYIRWHWNGGLELVMLALEHEAMQPDPAFRRDVLLPLAREVIAFFDQHFPREEGRIVFRPAQALETWQSVVNPAPDIAGLRAVLPRLLALPAVEIAKDQPAWARLLGELPELPARLAGTGLILAPARDLLGPRANIENPELYAVFPFPLYGVGRPDLELARRTYEERGIKRSAGWHQDAIQEACLGLTEQARDDVTHNFATHHPGSRFPAFWGPNYDWIPDQDHGSVAMTALQTMLMQCDGGRIRLFPAWPKAWGVSFRLHAPGGTVVEGEYREGKVVRLEVTPAERQGDVELMLPPDG